jgi:protein transport protein SEC24
VKIADLGTGGPPRCDGCGAFVANFSRWNGRGDAWTCHLCGAVNAAPQWRGAARTLFWR